MNKKFSIVNKDQIVSALNKLAPRPKTLYTAIEIAKTYRSKISQALKKGYSFKEITDIFNANNCEISEKELDSAYAHLCLKKIADKNNSSKNPDVSVKSAIKPQKSSGNKSIKV